MSQNAATQELTFIKTKNAHDDLFKINNQCGVVKWVRISKAMTSQ